MRRILTILLLLMTLTSCSLQEVASYLHKPVSKVTPTEVWFVTVWYERAKLHDQPFLKCTRAHESDSAGSYAAYNGSGPYYGAYQFLQNTWDNTTRSMGRTDLVHAAITRVPWWDQDAVAWWLYQRSGNGPWGGRC